MNTSSSNSPVHHTQKIKTQMRRLIDHLREDVVKVEEPKAQALFETSAEALTGLFKAFDDYESKCEEAWRIEPLGSQTIKHAVTDHPILQVIAERWSPYGFQDRPVEESDLRSLFEAVRWAPSSYNEQPWSYIVATKDNPEEHARILSCLVETNQAWAKEASTLVLCVVSSRFARNEQLNRAAVHDLGLAAGNLLAEATSRGLSVHQMIGILPDKAREIFKIPEHHEAWTAMAIGYKEDPAALPDTWKERDMTPRTRKPMREFVFTGQWGCPSPLGLKS